MQIWDLLVSSIDPVVLVDTEQDELQYCRIATSPAAGNADDSRVVHSNNNLIDSATDDDQGLNATNTANSFKLPTAGTQLMTGGTVVKLLRNYQQSKQKKELTCLSFNEKSPIIAVGDNLGTVLLYRVLEPQTHTHEGPIQQHSKLKATIMKLIDPSNVSRLQVLEENFKRNSINRNASYTSLAAGGKATLKSVADSTGFSVSEDQLVDKLGQGLTALHVDAEDTDAVSIN